jgi:hypothetical protein
VALGIGVGQPEEERRRAASVLVHCRHREAIMKSERGSAMIVVLTLTILVAALIVANGFVLSQLRAELKRIDHQQQQKFQSPKP